VPFLKNRSETRINKRFPAVGFWGLTPIKNMDLLSKIVSLTKHRGFIFPTSEIYGGLQSTYDFGPLGVELKNNIKKFWWQEIVYKHPEIFGLDSAILLHPKVWQASGHLNHFIDELVECKKCHSRFKAEDVKENKCPLCQGEMTSPRQFRAMFETYLGPIQSKENIVYLRPETAQGIFTNFKNIYQTQRAKIPFGIAQIGKAFRNEITVGNFIFRLREFEQMELEYFVKPEEADAFFLKWKEERMAWYLKMGIKKENLRFREHEKKELAHYAKATADIEYKFPWAWAEIEGIAHRADFDLKTHSQFSGEDLSYLDTETNQRYFPYVIEPSAGLERIFLALLCEHYQEFPHGRLKGLKGGTLKQQEVERVLALPWFLSPIKVAVFPLIKKEPLIKIAQDIFNEIIKYWPAVYDEKDSIGRRYRREDERGTPLAITIDFDTLKDKAVTIRNRDTMKQERIDIKEIKEYLNKIFNFEF